MSRLLLISIAAISHEVFSTSDAFSPLRKAFRDGDIRPLRPSFPAVTSTVQASITTGQMPEKHGIIANGYYDRDRMKVHFWEQSAKLCQVPRVWDIIKQRNPSARTAIIFWQNSIGSLNDIILTPAPIHKHHGGMIQDCYSKPDGLYSQLSSKFGKFNLHWYWGPLTSIRSTEWIARATAEVIRQFAPNLVLTYLPHLDYNQQRLGSSSPALEKDYRQLVEVAEELIHNVRRQHYDVLLLSEYAMSNVSGPIWINRELATAKLLKPRRVGKKKYLDYGQSRAFAMADHQVAHIYCNPDTVESVRILLETLDGVARVLGEEEQKEIGIRHERSGELIAIAAKDRWFAYPWWEHRSEAPDFAGHVDIHNKPGYDPLELFFDWRSLGISQDARLIKGSHGRTPDTLDEHAVIATTFPLPSKDTPVRDIDVFNLMVQMFDKPK